MVISFVQSTSETATVGTVSGTFTSTPGENNLAVIGLASIGGTVDGTVIGYNSAVLGTFGVAGLHRISLWYKVAGVGESAVVTAIGTAASGTANRMDIHMFEVSGNVTTSPLDVVGNQADPGSTVSSLSTGTTAVTSQANEISFGLIGLGGLSGGGTAWTNSFGGGFDTARCLSAYVVETATGIKESTASWTTARRAGGVIATFKAMGETVTVGDISLLGVGV